MGPRVAQCVAISILMVALCGAADSADKLSDLQARFDEETNAVRKAKMLQKLGDAQLAEAGRAESAGDFSTVGLILEKYRDNVRAACDALEKENPDAERHPGGYKQLEMHVQKVLREMDQFLLDAPDPLKPPLQIVRQDLINLDDKLLRSLFPRHAGAKPSRAPAPAPVPTDPGVHP
jgi:hypothetical protein